MKYLIIILLACALTTSVSGQEQLQSIITAASSSEHSQLIWTLGEISVSTYTTNDYILNEGFLQGEFTNNNTALSTTLLNFFIKKEKEKVYLNWEATASSELKKYVVERSPDGVQWKYQTDIMAKSGNQIANYSWIDHRPIKGLNYYRLKQIEYDEKFTYSKIVNIQIGEKVATSFSIFPNPAKDLVRVKSPNDQVTEIQLFNAQGRLVLHEKFVKEKVIEVHHLATGIYYLKLKSETMERVEKLIIE